MIALEEFFNFIIIMLYHKIMIYFHMFYSFKDTCFFNSLFSYLRIVLFIQFIILKIEHNVILYIISPRARAGITH
jgi:hypothetical protein